MDETKQPQDPQQPVNESEKKPVKRKRSKKQDVTGFEQHIIANPEVHKVVKEALTGFIKQQIEANKSAREIEAMVATCQEFMQSFVIFGYDMEGRPIEPIFCAHNQQEADALSMSLTRFFNSNIRNIP